jgi:hypothetical protein
MWFPAGRATGTRFTSRPIAPAGGRCGNTPSHRAKNRRSPGTEAARSWSHTTSERWGQFAVTQDGIYLIDSWAEAGPTLVYYDLRTRHTTSVLVLKESPKHGSSNLTATRDGRIVLYVQEERHGSILMAEKTQ